MLHLVISMIIGGENDDDDDDDADGYDVDVDDDDYEVVYHVTA